MAAEEVSTSTGQPVTILAERVEYLDEDGKLVTESLRDYTKKALRKRFASLNDFLTRWNASRSEAGDHRRTGGRRVCSSNRWPRRSARTSIRSISSAMLPSTSRR